MRDGAPIVVRGLRSEGGVRWRQLRVCLVAVICAGDGIKIVGCPAILEKFAQLLLINCPAIKAQRPATPAPAVRHPPS